MPTGRDTHCYDPRSWEYRASGRVQAIRGRDGESAMTEQTAEMVGVPGRRRVVAARAIDARKVYGSGETAVHALGGVDIEFVQGQFTAIMGPSGSGKSTLMHCMAGLDPMSSGQAFIGDVELSGLSDQNLTLLRRDKLGFIFQSFNLVPTLTAMENMLLPLRLAGREPDADWVELIVSTVGMADRRDHRPNELSGGQQQRVAVARALVGRPELVFADEPTGNLDRKTGVEILAFMRDAVNRFNQTIVMVTRDPNAASYADRVVFLADGKIVDEMVEPTADRVIDRMKRFGE